jgi:acyl carrier protein
MGVLELIAFVQDEFGIQVSDNEITEENFGTLTGIASYVLSKRAAAPAT